MNYLIAKKKRTINKYLNIITDDAEFYAIPADLTPHRIFENDYKLEDDEWFGIPNFTATEFCIPLLTQEFNSAEHNQIGNNQFDLIKFFCAYQADNFYCFQKFFTGNLIKRKWFNLTGEPSLKSDQPIFIISKVPDAIFDKAANILYFKKLGDLKSIFPKTIDLYIEATDEQTETFLSNDFINLDDNYSKDKVKSANRKRITMATKTLEQFSADEVKLLYIGAAEYCPELNFNAENSTFDIATEEHLKMLIYVIEQRYYTTSVGAIKRVANSVTPIIVQIP